MNNSKILMALLCFLIMVLSALSVIAYKTFFNFDQKSAQDQVSTSNSEDRPTDVPAVNDVILTMTQDAGQEYIDKLYFVGDSTTYHFHKGGIDKNHIFVPDSLTLMLTSDIDTVIVGNKGLTISEAIKDADSKIVIITIGVNGADHFTEVKYKTYYKKLIDSIQEASPNTSIILQSVFPVTKSYSDLNKGITNKGIDQLNVWAKELAFEEEVRYLDTQSILKDENGAQMEKYSELDGVHLNSEAYYAIIEYIRTHAIDGEKR